MERDQEKPIRLPLAEWSGRVMSGEVSLAEVPDMHRAGVAHIIARHVFSAAASVLEGRSRMERNDRLNQWPAKLRPLISEQATILFERRRKEGQRGTQK